MIKTAFYLGTTRARPGSGSLNKHPSILYLNSFITDLQQIFYEIIPFKLGLGSFSKELLHNFLQGNPL